MKLFSKNIPLSLITGLILIPGWYEWGTGLTLLIAFVPLLVLMSKNIGAPGGGRTVFLSASLAFFIFNVGTTWWIRNSLVNNKPSYAALATAALLTTLLMSVAIWLAYQSWKKWGRKTGLFATIIFWLAYEFAFTHGEIAWPWLSLGNGFAYQVQLIQWYEITGAFGGTLWVLVVNVLIFSVFIRYTKEVDKSTKTLSILIALIIVLPITFSLIRYYTYTETQAPKKIVVVQPNIDPYLKFNDIDPIEQTQIQLNEANQYTDSTIDYVVGPETSIMNNIWIDRFERVPDLIMIKEFQKNYPKLKYVTGILCYQMYKPGEARSPTARPYRKNSKNYFDSYNSAIQIDSTKNIQLYHKSQLVVGIEKMPYPALLKILKPITMELGGTFRSHNTQKEREVFIAPGDSVKIAPVICYESVFGEYVTDYIKKGANLIFVITNDGWWGNSPGHKQHNAIASIRAIETRRSIARSANTGMSSFINQRGDMLQKLGWWKRGAIVETINANTHITFYVKHGDYIGRVAFFIAVLLVLFLISLGLRKKITKTQL